MAADEVADISGQDDYNEGNNGNNEQPSMLSGEDHQEI